MFTFLTYVKVTEPLGEVERHLIPTPPPPKRKIVDIFLNFRNTLSIMKEFKTTEPDTENSLRRRFWTSYRKFCEVSMYELRL